MHPDSKLTNHGKQVNSSAQSQHQNVSQGPAGSLGSKGAGAGNHGGGGGGKANQISPGNSGLKSQAGGGVGPLKGKRERSVSIDSGEQREALTPSLEPDSKVEGVMRSKRRCVLEKKQPYSGDEWCSGAESEEEEDKPITAAPGPAKHRGDHSRAGPPQPPPGSNPLSSLCESASSVVPLGMGAGLRAELGSGPKPLVYVFTTNLANSAAEAVMQGRADSIVVFHQQTVPRTKLDKCPPPPSKLPGLPDQLHAATPPGGTPKSQSGTPRPSSSGQLNPAGTPSSVGPPDGATDEPPDALTLPSSSGGNKNSSSTNNHSNNSLPQSGGSATNSSSSKPLPGLVEPPSVPPTPPPPAPAQQGDSDPGNVPAQRGGNTEGLSKQQLEHRERSLQTLRDIERLLLRSGGGGGVVGPGGDPSNNNNGSLGANCSNNGPNSSPQAPPPPPLGGNPNQQQQVKKYEEPLQSIISQTQSLVGGLDEPAMSQGGCGGPPPPPHLQHPHPPHSHMHPSHHGLPPHSSPSSLDMCLLMNQQDGLTPEQMAWRKLQEEYYQEKRRKQEQIGLHPHPHPHPRMMGDGGPEMGMAGMIRGPPPPYHSKAGEPLPPQQQQWLPGMAGGGGNGGRMLEMHLEGGGPRGPRFHPGMQRLGPGPGGGGYPGGGNPGGMMGLDPMGPMNPMQRPPGRPGMGWLEDMPPMGGGGGGGPPVGFGGYPPMQHLQGDPERMLNPRAREEMFRMMEKRQIQGMQRQAAMNQAMEMERMQQQQGGGNGPRMMEQAGGPGGGFANSVGDPMDFPGSRAMMGSPMGGVGCGGGHQQPPMRELVEHQMGNLNMNMNVNMNMNLNLQMTPQQQQQMLMTQKMRLAGGPLNELLHQEEMARSRAQNGGGMAGNKMMMPGGGPFPNQGPFPGGPGGYLPQDMGNPQTPQEMFSPDQQGPPMGGTSRLSHMPRSGGGVLGGRRPSDLTINVHPMNSPGMPPHHLKSPTVNQVHSPMLPSPSPAGLKSPQLSSLGGPPNPGPPPSSSMKSSPQVLGPSSLGVRSPTGGSPSQLKSPSVPVPSPGAWAPSPKTALPSPGVPQGGKGGNAMDSGPHPPRSNTCGGINPSMPFTSSPGGAPSQNPLSLIMSQMSKYAMPSSTPLYHDAIKTIATSDDELLPDRPLLPGGNMAGVGGNHQPPPMHSPMGMVLPGQQPPLSHDPSGPMLHSPNPMNMPSMHGGGGNPMLMAGGPQDHMGPRNGSPMLPQNQMGGGVTGGGFPRLQPPPHGPMHSPGMGMGGGLPQAYPPGMTLPPPDEVMVPHPGQMHLLKGLSHQQQQHRPPSASYLGDADLSDVIRSTPTGIPEFDLSRIIPSEKPSSTLQYFPKSNESLQQQQPHHKQQQQPPSSSSSSNPHLINLQNMMAEQQLPVQPPPGRPPMGGPRPMGGMGGMQMCHPGHMMGRTAMPPPQQGMMVNNMHPHPGVMSPSQHSLLAQQNLMMMQAKQQRSMSVSGDMYGQQGHLMSPQGALMGPPNLQQGMMVPAQMRQRSISLDGPMGYGPGSMANLPF